MIVWSTNSSIQEAEVERSSISKLISKGHKISKSVTTKMKKEKRNMSHLPRHHPSAPNVTYTCLVLILKVNHAQEITYARFILYPDWSIISHY